MARARRPSGFTLIELMISVAIVGVLASVAIPALSRSTLRAKVSERRAIMLRIKQAIQDYQLRNGAVVSGDSDYNPPFPPTMGKRAMATDRPLWNTYFSAEGGGSSIPAEIEGAVYYSYRFVIDDTPARGTITIWAAGDLDGDGVVSYKQIVFTRIAGAYQLTSETPLLGSEDDAGPYATF